MTKRGGGQVLSLLPTDSDTLLLRNRFEQYDLVQYVSRTRNKYTNKHIIAACLWPHCRLEVQSWFPLNPSLTAIPVSHCSHLQLLLASTAVWGPLSLAFLALKRDKQSKKNKIKILLVFVFVYFFFF